MKIIFVIFVSIFIQTKLQKYALTSIVNVVSDKMKKLELDGTDRFFVMIGGKLDLDITIEQAHKMLAGRQLDLDPSNVTYLIKKKD